MLTYTGSLTGPSSSIDPVGPRDETEIEPEPRPSLIVEQLDINVIQSEDDRNSSEEPEENYDEEFPMFPTTDQHEWQKVKHINKHNRRKGDSNHKESEVDNKFKKLADAEERREGRPRRVQYGKDTVIVKKKKTVNGLTVAEKNSWLFIII